MFLFGISINNNIVKTSKEIRIREIFEIKKKQRRDIRNFLK